jgi:hypothetical protein
VYDMSKIMINVLPKEVVMVNSKPRVPFVTQKSLFVNEIPVL